MYSLLAPLLNEEVVIDNKEELYCVDIMRASMVEKTEVRNHCLTDCFASPLLQYVEPDRIIHLSDLKKKLFKFFVSWKSTKEALSFLIDQIEKGCIESRLYFLAETATEPCVGSLIGLWWSAMPSEKKLKIQTMYGNHEFETWISGTRPGMNARNTPYLAQLVFVLREIQKELFSHAKKAK